MARSWCGSILGAPIGLIWVGDGISQEVSRVKVGGIGLPFPGVILMRVIMHILRH